MKIRKTHFNSIEKVVDAIKQNKVVIIPTDTIYGFSAKAPQVDAEIRRIKGRGETKPFIQLIADPNDVYNFTDKKIPQKILNLWPGPLTIIVPCKENFSIKTVALRCPSDEWLRIIIKKCGSPIFSTSVNRSGFENLWQIEDIESEFGNEVALIVDDGDKPQGKASTLIDLTGDEMKIIRQGDLII